MADEGDGSSAGCACKMRRRSAAMDWLPSAARAELGEGGARYLSTASDHVAFGGGGGRRAENASCRALIGLVARESSRRERVRELCGRLSPRTSSSLLVGTCLRYGSTFAPRCAVRGACSGCAKGEAGDSAERLLRRCEVGLVRLNGSVRSTTGQSSSPLPTDCMYSCAGLSAIAATSGFASLPLAPCVSTSKSGGTDGSVDLSSIAMVLLLLGNTRTVSASTLLELLPPPSSQEQLTAVTPLDSLRGVTPPRAGPLSKVGDSVERCSQVERAPGPSSG